MEILTVTEAAEFLKLKPSSIYSLTKTRGIARARARGEKILPVIRVSGNLRFSKNSLIEWLKSLEQKQ